jgi:hypothetical protein
LYILIFTILRWQMRGGKILKCTGASIP